ncbi:MAG TPA: Fe-S protein assembly co-chaperone HscB [Rickettsiales bacterium]|nr:Fe-S protein assembly co-chaperone HscB [Rickettsiales bacterium]
MKNYFKIFNLEEKFDINLDTLEQKYFDFQQQFHPDRAGISEIEKSILVNEAYEILKNPLHRASHILQLHNINIEKDKNAPKADIATLSEVLEIQEKIPEMSLQEKKNLKKQLEERIATLLQEIGLSLDNQEFNEAAQILMRIKYFDKTLRDL